MRSNIGSSIARDMAPITGHDANIQRFTGIKCKGTAGDVVVVTLSGETRTIPMVSGEVEPIAVQKVLLTGTTATGLWGYKVFDQVG